MDDAGDWMEAAGTVPDEIRHVLFKVVCRLTNCSGRGHDDGNDGRCALCADIADNVVGEYLVREGDVVPAKLIARAVAAEREACKQIADQVQKNMGEECDFGAGMVSKLIAARGTE
jgi:hypothetical protein